MTHHQRQKEVCDIVTADEIEGFDKDQEKKLRNRKRSTLNEVEKWKETYRILFPADTEDLIPSPCKLTDPLSITLTVRV